MVLSYRRSILPKLMSFSKPSSELHTYSLKTQKITNQLHKPFPLLKLRKLQQVQVSHDRSKVNLRERRGTYYLSDVTLLSKTLDRPDANMICKIGDLHAKTPQTETT